MDRVALQSVLHGPDIEFEGVGEDVVSVGDDEAVGRVLSGLLHRAPLD